MFIILNEIFKVASSTLLFLKSGPGNCYLFVFPVIFIICIVFFSYWRRGNPKYLAEPSWLSWLKFDWQLQNLCSIYHFFCVRNLICPFCQKFSKCILSIEKIQKIALKIILGDDYSSYYMSCLEFGLDLHSTPLYKLCNQTVQKWQVWTILCTLQH